MIQNGNGETIRAGRRNDMKRNKAPGDEGVEKSELGDAYAKKGTRDAVKEEHNNRRI